MDSQPLSPRPRRWQAAPGDESMTIVDQLLSPANGSSTYLSAPSSPLAERSERSLSPLSPPVPGRFAFNVNLPTGKTVMPPIRGFGRPTGPRRSLKGRGGSAAAGDGLKRDESVKSNGTSASQDQAFKDVLSSLDTLSSSRSSSSLSSLVNPHPPRRTPSPQRPRSTLSISSGQTSTRTNSFLTGPRTPNRSTAAQPLSTPSRAAGLIAMFEKKAGDSPLAAPLTKSMTGGPTSPVKPSVGLSSSLGPAEKLAVSDDVHPGEADRFTALDKGKGKEVFEDARPSFERTASSPAMSLLKSFPLSGEGPPILKHTPLSPIPASASSIRTSPPHDTPPPPPAKDVLLSIHSLTQHSSAPEGIKTSPSPLSSVRNMVAAWRNRYTGAPEDGKNKNTGVRGRGRNALGEGFLSIRRRNGRFGDRERIMAAPLAVPGGEEQLATNSSSSLAPLDFASAPPIMPQPTLRHPAPHETERARVVSQALSVSGEPLRSGTLYYLNVHDMAMAPDFKWIQADARLYPTALSLSWMTPAGGRAVVVLDLLWCQEVRSIPSPNHPSAVADIGSIAARQQQLGDTLYPFQMVYDDGLERLGCESARDRVRWVGAIWDALERAPPPGRSSSLFPNRSEEGSSEGGSASTTYNNPFAANRLSRADSLLLPPSAQASIHRTADDAVIETSGGLTAPIAQRGSRRLAAGNLDRHRSLRRVASEADLELAEPLPENHRHTMASMPLEPPPLTADVARSRPASRDFAFAGGIPPPRLDAPFISSQRSATPPNQHTLLMPSPFDPSQMRVPAATHREGSSASSDVYETAATREAYSRQSLYTAVSVPGSQSSGVSPAPSYATGTRTSPFKPTKVETTVYEAVQSSDMGFETGTFSRTVARTVMQGPSTGPSVYGTASNIESSATARVAPSRESYTTKEINETTIDGHSVTTPVSTLSRSVRTARSRLDNVSSSGGTSGPPSSYDTAPPPPPPHSLGSRPASAANTRYGHLSEPSFRSASRGADPSVAEDWETGTQISEPESDAELLYDLERQSSVGSRYPSYRTTGATVYRTATTAATFRTAQAPPSDSQYATAHSPHCHTQYLTASICTCQESASMYSSVSRPTSIASFTAASESVVAPRAPASVSTARSTKVSTTGRSRRVPISAVESVASTVFGGVTTPTKDSLDDAPERGAGSIISADVNKLLNYLEGHETARQGRQSRLGEQLNRIETNVYGISHAITTKDAAPPVPSKEGTPPSSPSGSTPSTPSSVSSTSTARPVMPPAPNDAIAGELDDMRSMLATLLGRTNNILDAQALAKKSESATRGPTLHRIEDLLRRLLVRSGDSEIADEMGLEQDYPPPSPPLPHRRGKSVSSASGVTASNYRGGGSVYSDQALLKAPAPPGSLASFYDRDGNLTPVPDSLLDGDLPEIDFDEDFELRNLPPAEPPHEDRVPKNATPRGLHNIWRKMGPAYPSASAPAQEPLWPDYEPAPPRPTHRHSPHVPSPVPKESLLEEPRQQSYYDESPDEELRDDHRRRHPSPPTPQPIHVPSPVGPGFRPSPGFGPPPMMRQPMMGPPMPGMDVPRMNMPRIASSRDPISTTYFRRGFPPVGPGMGMGPGMGLGMFPGPMGVGGPDMGPFMPGLRPGFGGPMGPNVNPALRRPGFFPPGIPGASGDYGLPRDAGHLSRMDGISRPDPGLPDSGLGISGTSTPTTTTPTTATTPTPQPITPSDPPGHIHSASDATHVTDDSFKRALGNSQALAEAQGEQQNEISRYLHGVSDQIEAGRKQQHDELAGILRDINDLRSQIDPPQHVQGHVQLDGTVQLETGEIVDGVHGEPVNTIIAVPAVPAVPAAPAVAVTVAPGSLYSSSQSSHVRGAVLPDGTVVADGKIVDGVHGTNLLPSSPVISDGQLKDIEQDIKLSHLQDRVSELMQRTTPRSSDGTHGHASPTIVPLATAPPIIVADDVIIGEPAITSRPMGNYTDVVREKTVQKEREVIREGPGYHHKEVDREDIVEKDHEHDDTGGLSLPAPPTVVVSAAPPVSVRVNPRTGRPLTTPSLLGAGGPMSVSPPSAAGDPHLVRETIEEITQLGPGAPVHTKVTHEFTTNPNAPTLATASQMGSVPTQPAGAVPVVEVTEVVHETLRPNAVGPPGLVRTSEVVTEIDPMHSSAMPNLPALASANLPLSGAAPAASAAPTKAASNVSAGTAPPMAASNVPAAKASAASASNVPATGAPAALPMANVGNAATPSEPAGPKPIFATNHPKPVTMAANVPAGPPPAALGDVLAGSTGPAMTAVPVAPGASVPMSVGDPTAVIPKTGKRVHYQPLMPYKPVATVPPRSSQQPPASSAANVPNTAPPASAPVLATVPTKAPNVPAASGAPGLSNVPSNVPAGSSVPPPSNVPFATVPATTSAPHNGTSKVKTESKTQPGSIPAVLSETDAIPEGGAFNCGMPQAPTPVLVEADPALVKPAKSGSVLRKTQNVAIPPGTQPVASGHSSMLHGVPTAGNVEELTSSVPGKEVHFASSQPGQSKMSLPSASSAASRPPAFELEEVILPDGRTAYIKKAPPEMMEEEQIVLPDGRKATVPRQPRPNAKLTKLPTPPPAHPSVQMQTPAGSSAPVVVPSARPVPPPAIIPVPGTHSVHNAPSSFPVSVPANIPATVPVSGSTSVPIAIPTTVPASLVIDKPGSSSNKLTKKPSKVVMSDQTEIIPDTMHIPADHAAGSSTLPQVPTKPGSGTGTVMIKQPPPTATPEELLAKQKRLANVAKANAEKAAAEAAEKERIHKAKADKAKLAADRHQANVEALADLRRAFDLQGGDDKAWKTVYNEGVKNKEKRRADKVTRDKKWQDALDKLLADKEEMKKHREAADKKPGSQAILDALKTASDQQSAFLRKMAAEIMDHNSNQHKLTQTEAQKWAREQVGFNLAGYLDDFSKALSGEVRTLLKEVGDLRESRRALQYELAELLLMKGRQSGGDLMAVMPYPAAPPKPAPKKEEPKKDAKPPAPKAPVPAAMWTHWGQPYPPPGLQPAGAGPVGGPARPLPFPGLVPGPPPAAPAQPAGSRPLPAV